MSITTVIIQKTSQEDSGLFLYKDNQGRIVIHEIQRGGIFENSSLQPFMQILSVNGIQCSELDDVTAKSIIDKAGGEVVLEVMDMIIYDAIVVDGDEMVDNLVGLGGDSNNVTLTATPLDIEHISEAEQIHQHLIQRSGRGGSERDFNDDERDGNFLAMVAGGRPPEGLPEGGEWRKTKYNGARTILLCLGLAFFTGIFSCCGTCAFLCPQDRIYVYVVDDRIYSREGLYLGRSSTFRYVE